MESQEMYHHLCKEGVQVKEGLGLALVANTKVASFEDSQHYKCP